MNRHKESWPTETNDFCEGKLPDPDKKIIDTNKKILNLQIKDYGWKIDSRKWFGWSIFGLLIAQNITVFVFIFIAYFGEKLADIQYTIGLIIAGTLIETSLCIKHLIKWLFTDIDYKLHKY